jgi:dTDP-4-amino-4,6-dideoxygalactose transaminase
MSGMRIGRTIPPAAARLTIVDAWRGIRGALDGERAIRALEEDFLREFGVRHAFSLSSGTAALLVTLKALKSVSPRRDVVMPAFTCYSVAAAVVQAGLTPVLCDVDAGTFDFDEARLVETVNGRTLCVIAHHLFGVPAAIARVRLLCERHGSFLVEDAAQALGIAADGRPLGTLGDAGIFSFGRGKHVTGGSGGMVVTNSPVIAAAVQRQYDALDLPPRVSQAIDFLKTLLMLAFIRPWLYWVPAALPFLELGRTIYPARIAPRRLSGVQAGLLRHWRRRLARSNDARREAVSYFARTLSPGGSGGEVRPYLRFPIVAPDSRTRRRVCSLAQKRGLGIAVAYPAPINEIPEIASAFDGQRFPSAAQLSERLLTLPTHHWLSERDKRAIAAVCRELAAA